jgi:hypothetical protein
VLLINDLLNMFVILVPQQWNSYMDGFGFCAQTFGSE